MPERIRGAFFTLLFAHSEQQHEQQEEEEEDDNGQTLSQFTPHFASESAASTLSYEDDAIFTPGKQRRTKSASLASRYDANEGKEKGKGVKSYCT